MKKSILHTSAIVAGATLLYKILGFIEKVALASVFGTRPEADAYLAAAAVVLLMGFLLADIAAPALIPLLLAEPDHAQSTLRTISGLVLLVSLPLTGLAIVGSDQLARLFGPGFAPQTHALASQVIKIGMLAFPALCLTSILTAWYQTYDRFARPAFADLALKLAPVLGIIVTRSVYGLAWGLVIGAMVRCGLLLSPSVPIMPRFRLRDQRVQQVLHNAMPLLMTSLVSVHLISVIENAIASTVSSGAVAAMTYARRIVEVPVILAPQVIARVVFPWLSQLAIDRDFGALQRLLQRSIRFTVAGLAPLTILGMVLATPLVRLLLERGAFDQTAVQQTSLAMLTAMPGLPALALTTLLMRFNYAVGDTRRPSMIRVAGAFAQIGLALWWRRWGIAGIGLAATVALWLETIAMLVVARRAVHASHASDRAFWLMTGIASMTTAASTWWLMHQFDHATGTLALLLELSGVSVVGLLGYGGTFWLLGGMKLLDLQDRLQARDARL